MKINKNTEILRQFIRSNMRNTKSTLVDCINEQAMLKQPNINTNENRSRMLKSAEEKALKSMPITSSAVLSAPLYDPDKVPISPRIYEETRQSITVGALPEGPLRFEDAVRSALPGKINADGTITTPTYDEALTNLRKNGMQKEINYSHLDKTMSMVLSSQESHRYLNIISPYVSLDKANYLASTYSSLKYRINQDYSGEDLQREIGKLDNFMKEKIDSFSNAFADRMDEYRNMIGLENEREKLSESMKAVINEQTKQYDSYIQHNDIIPKNEDKWLVRHTDYVSSNLRESYKPYITAHSENLYTCKELVAMSEFERVSLPAWYGDFTTGVSDEEVGLRLGMTALKTDILIDSTSISGKFKEAVEVFAKKLIDERISNANRACMCSDDIPTPLDENTVRNIIDVMRKQYADDKNISKAIESGSAIAKKHFYEKLNSYGSSRTERIKIKAPARYRADSGIFAYLNRGGYGVASTLEQFNHSISEMIKGLKLSADYQMDAKL